MNNIELKDSLLRLVCSIIIRDSEYNDIDIPLKENTIINLIEVEKLTIVLDDNTDVILKLNDEDEYNIDFVVNQLSDEDFNVIYNRLYMKYNMDSLIMLSKSM